jgi:hypothetical protein
MGFKQDNKQGDKIQKGQVLNPNGRPKKLVSKVLDELKEEGEQVSKSQVFDIYQIMISLTIPKLKEVAGDESKPALYRILAKEILGKKGFEAIEKMLDRANGKPMITQEIKQENTGDTIKVVFESTGVKLPQSENDFIDD